MAAFRDAYRSIHVLVLDDIDILAGKERTQEACFHTFNTLHEAGHQIVLTSDTPPALIQGLDDRLRTRFVWGPVADIQPPDLETKCAIIREKAHGEGFDLPDDVVLFVARRVRENVRELEGYLNRVIVYCTLTGQPATLDTARNALTPLLPEERHVTAADVIRFIAHHYGVKVADLKGRDNRRSVAFPRQVAIYLIRELLPLLPRDRQALCQAPLDRDVLRRDHHRGAPLRIPRLTRPSPRSRTFPLSCGKPPGGLTVRPRDSPHFSTPCLPHEHRGETLLTQVASLASWFSTPSTTTTNACTITLLLRSRRESAPMDVTLNRSVLLDELQLIQEIISAAAAIPILSNILLSAEGDRLHLSATDLDVTVYTQCSAVVRREGRTTVQGKVFVDLVRSLPTDTLDLSFEESASRSAPAPSARSWRASSPPTSEHYRRCRNGFCGSTSRRSPPSSTRSVFTVSSEEGHFQYNAALLLVSAKALEMVATDGHHLAWARAAHTAGTPRSSSSCCRGRSSTSCAT